MGLDTTHDAWHGPYSFFMEWRKEVARHIGMDLSSMDGYEGIEPWDKWKEHDLYPLLIHSDCDGELTVDECRKIHRGLLAIQHKIIDAFLLEKTIDFIQGCELAVSRNENIEFR